MNKKLPLVCIVIVNWNGGEKIKNCLKSLKETKYSNYKVILVDNGSKEGSVEELKKIIKMDVLYLEKNYGYTIATNRGWKYGIEKYKADYICAMDSDIITIQPNWLKLEIDELEKDKMRGIGCGKLVFQDDRLQLLYLGRETNEYQEKDKGQYDFIKEVPAVGGACIIIKKKLIETLGYYDENFFYGPNDLDYCLRAGKLGYKIVYNGFAKSIHLGSSSYLASEHTKIYEPQAYGNILFQLRSFGNIKGAKMIINQFIRIFITRKYPFSPIRANNLNFHRDVLKRGKLWIKAVYKSLKNKNTIINLGKEFKWE